MMNVNKECLQKYLDGEWDLEELLDYFNSNGLYKLTKVVAAAHQEGFEEGIDYCSPCE